MRKIIPLLLICFSLNFFASCYRIRGSKGGGQRIELSERKINISDISVSPGYKIEAIVTGLTFPTGITFDDNGKLYAVEAGYSYGEVWTEPKLLRIEPSGVATTIASGERNGPWTGVTFYNGDFYIAEGGEANGGKILKITDGGKLSSL